MREEAGKIGKRRGKNGKRREKIGAGRRGGGGKGESR